MQQNEEGERGCRKSTGGEGLVTFEKIGGVANAREGNGGVCSYGTLSLYRIIVLVLHIVLSFMQQPVVLDGNSSPIYRFTACCESRPETNNHGEKAVLSYILNNLKAILR